MKTYSNKRKKKDTVNFTKFSIYTSHSYWVCVWLGLWSLPNSPFLTIETSVGVKFAFLLLLWFSPFLCIFCNLNVVRYAQIKEMKEKTSNKNTTIKRTTKRHVRRFSLKVQISPVFACFFLVYYHCFILSSASLTELSRWGLFQQFWKLWYNGETESFSAQWEPNGAFFLGFFS